MQCSICGLGLEANSDDGAEWNRHNARPINDGTCCAACDIHIVAPRRLVDTHNKWHEHLALRSNFVSAKTPRVIRDVRNVRGRGVAPIHLLDSIIQQLEEQFRQLEERGDILDMSERNDDERPTGCVR